VNERDAIDAREGDAELCVTRSYDISAFWFLGLVVEKASGMRYEEYLKTEIFEPVGKTRSVYCDHGASVPHGAPCRRRRRREDGAWRSTRTGSAESLLAPLLAPRSTHDGTVRVTTTGQVNVVDPPSDLSGRR
jgi:CubicO group peptidase (beta-lactamase class C family)